LPVLAAGAAWLTRASRGATTPAARAEESVARVAPGLAPAREPLEAAPAAPLPGTARAFLAEYHGARWPEIEAAMERAELKLDQPFVAQPWEEVEPAIRAQARLDAGMRQRIENKDWVAPLTNEWLQAEYKWPQDLVLDGAELAELEAQLAHEMQALQAADKAYADRLDFHLQSAFEQGEYVRAPFSTCGLDDEEGFFVKGIASGTWAAGIILRDEECPDLVEMRNEIQLLEHERDRRVDAFLAARRRR